MCIKCKIRYFNCVGVTKILLMMRFKRHRIYTQSNAVKQSSTPIHTTKLKIKGDMHKKNPVLMLLCYVFETKKKKKQNNFFLGKANEVHKNE